MSQERSPGERKLDQYPSLDPVVAQFREQVQKSIPEFGPRLLRQGSRLLYVESVSPLQIIFQGLATGLGLDSWDCQISIPKIFQAAMLLSQEIHGSWLDEEIYWALHLFMWT